jgi:RNA polymerase sigma factor FliA
MGKAKKKSSRTGKAAPTKRTTKKAAKGAAKKRKKSAATRPSAKKTTARKVAKKTTKKAGAVRKASGKKSQKRATSRATTRKTTKKSSKGKARKAGSSAATTRSRSSRPAAAAMTRSKTTVRKAAAKKTKTTTRSTAKTTKKATKKVTPKVVGKTAKKITPPRRPKKLSMIAIAELPTDKLWSLYRVEAAKHPKRTKRTKELSKRLEDLRNILMERHYPLVRYIAERLLQTLPKSIELDDLISAGLFGLMDAIRGFDATRGIKFKTYCSTRIRGAILDQLRSQDWVPRLVRLKASRIERALQRLTAAYGREPTHAELARSLEMDHQDLVKELQEARAKSMFSLSEKWEDDDGSVEKVEILEDKHAIDPVGELNRIDLMSYITRALTHKERFIIEQYYQYGHTMREIGEMLALTESRVCQIHSNVMGRLNSLLGQKQHQLLS